MCVCALVSVSILNPTMATLVSYLCPSIIQPSVDVLQSQFQAYEQSQEQVEHILRHWDRALLVLLVPVPTEDSATVSEEAVSEKRVSACCLT